MSYHKDLHAIRDAKMTNLKCHKMNLRINLKSTQRSDLGLKKGALLKQFSVLHCHGIL